jgi:hypothetical protein
MQQVTPDLLGPESIGRTVEIAREILDDSRVGLDSGVGEIAQLHIADHSLS